MFGEWINLVMITFCITDEFPNLLNLFPKVHQTFLLLRACMCVGILMSLLFVDYKNVHIFQSHETSTHVIM